MPKTCYKCLESRPPEEFYRDKRARDGLKSECKVCFIAMSMAYARRNKDKANATNRRWRKANPEKFRDSLRRSQRKHREQRREDTLAWERKNPERHKEIMRAGRRNYKARKRAAEGSHSADDIKALWDAQSGLCAICSVHLDETGYHADHVVALARGGTNWPDNLQLLCPTCNCSKKDRPMDIVLAERAEG